MNQQETQETNDQAAILQDLPVPDAAEIKGGPSTQSHRDVILKTSATSGQTDDDDTLRGTTLNHKETTVEDEEETKALDDLAPADEQQTEVKGRMLSSGRVRVSSSSGC